MIQGRDDVSQKQRWREEFLQSGNIIQGQGEKRGERENKGPVIAPSFGFQQVSG